MRIMASKQHGFSFSGFLMVAVILIFAVVGGMKIIPSYMQDSRIKNIFNTIVHDPAMQNASVKDIRESFSKRAMMDNITIVQPSDIEIEKNNGGISLSVNYSVKVPLVANASLILEFNPSSTK